MSKAYVLQPGAWTTLRQPPRRRLQWFWRRHWREFSLLSLGVFALVWHHGYQVRPALATAPQIGGLVALSPNAAPATISLVTATAPASHPVLPADTSSISGATGQQPGSRRNSYAFGNCTYYVAIRRYVPSGWGNARNWFYAATKAGYHVDNRPIDGAIAWTPMGYYGHVAYVEQVQGDKVLISEMNFAGWNRISQRWVPVGEFKYIY